MRRSPESRTRASLGRPFWLVWSANTVSSLGDGIRYVAFPLLAASISHDPRAVALVSVAGFLPWPGRVAGTVTSSYRVIGLGAMPVGAGAAGLLAKGYGLHMPYLVSGLVLAVATVACLPFITEVQVHQAEAERCVED